MSETTTAPKKRKEKTEQAEKKSHANLASAKLGVMQDVPYLQKTKKKELSYSFAGEAALLAKLHPALIEHGIAFGVVESRITTVDSYVTSKGSKMNRAIVCVKYSLTHAASGEKEIGEASGEGADVGDKSVPKAMTQALKYFLRQTFLIETGDDPDLSDSAGPMPQSVPSNVEPPRQGLPVYPTPSAPPQTYTAPVTPAAERFQKAVAFFARTDLTEKKLLATRLMYALNQPVSKADLPRYDALFAAAWARISKEPLPILDPPLANASVPAPPVSGEHPGEHPVQSDANEYDYSQQQ